MFFTNRRCAARQQILIHTANFFLLFKNKNSPPPKSARAARSAARALEKENIPHPFHTIVAGMAVIVGEFRVARGRKQITAKLAGTRI